MKVQRKINSDEVSQSLKTFFSGGQQLLFVWDYQIHGSRSRLSGSDNRWRRIQWRWWLTFSCMIELFVEGFLCDLLSSFFFSVMGEWSLTCLSRLLLSHSRSCLAALSCTSSFLIWSSCHTHPTQRIMFFSMLPVVMTQSMSLHFLWLKAHVNT